MNIYVSNLSAEVSEAELRQAFQAFGRVDSVTTIKDKLSGLSRGFAFVEMPSKVQAQAAMRGLNNEELKRQQLIVSEARPRADDRRGGRREGSRRRSL